MPEDQGPGDFGGPARPSTLLTGLWLLYHCSAPLACLSHLGQGPSALFPVSSERHTLATPYQLLQTAMSCQPFSMTSHLPASDSQGDIRDTACVSSRSTIFLLGLNLPGDGAQATRRGRLLPCRPCGIGLVFSPNDEGMTDGFVFL